MDRWMKYLAITAAFAGIGARVFGWLRKSQAESSPGGKDLTMDEIAQLNPVINDAINEGLRAADIPLMFQGELISLD